MHDTSPGQRKASLLSRIRPFVSGLLPLFLVAHFGHHVVGAMLSPLMPMIRNQLGLNYTRAGTLSAVFSVVGGFAQLPAGWLADRFGSRWMILISVSGVALGGVLIGMSHSFGALVVFLALTALLGGGYHPASATAISTITPPERRGRALGLHLIGGSSAFWVTPLLAVPIAAAWGWRTSFLTLSMPVMVLGIVLFFLMRRQARIAEAANRNKPATTAAAGSPARVNWRVLLPFLILTVGTGMITQSVGAFYVLYAVDYAGASAATAGLLMAVVPIVGAFVAPVGGYLSDRFGAVRVVVASALLAGPLLYLMSLVNNVLAFACVLVLIGITNMARAPSAEAYFVTHIPLQRRATILGIYFFAGMELAGVATPLAGRLIDTPSIGFTTVLVGAAVAQVLLAVVCALFLRWGEPPAGNPGAE